MKRVQIPMLKFEKEQWLKSEFLIAGVDEVGRGSFAGPIVAAAVVWKYETLKSYENHPEITTLLSAINDSKKLSKTRREELDKFIKENCLEYKIAEIDSKIIDTIGIGKANKEVLIEAVMKLETKVDHILIDFFNITSDKLNIPFTSIKRGDEQSISIAAASIIAKVYRDKLMTEYHLHYPQYGFDSNVGYGTKFHREAIAQYGLSPIHRKSYKIGY